jgi:thioesterase domain-containing protein
MATQYIGAMRVVQPKGPYFVGGMCAGGIVALEIAQQLCFMGEKVGPLMLIDPPMEPFRTPIAAAMKFPKKQNIFYVINFLYTSWKRKKFKIKAIERLKKREKEGRIALNTSDQKALQIAARSAINFRLALSDYRMKPYCGRVLLLASQERLLKKKGDVRNSLIGDVRIFDVGDRHGIIHDIHNERFSESIHQSFEIASEYMNGI